MGTLGEYLRIPLSIDFAEVLDAGGAWAGFSSAAGLGPLAVEVLGRMSEEAVSGQDVRSVTASLFVFVAGVRVVSSGAGDTLLFVFEPGREQWSFRGWEADVYGEWEHVLRPADLRG